ncbi:Hsp33 family molecular chaperone HslO [Dethiothermospora halolimnae]|uniref:Hsp33 family molecular chaperone HslO n=1 Tax=Dethiothermospora halolimnae TaxID=3114390 RepID=UPI003CCC24CE
MKDYLIRAIDEERSIRVFIATTTNMVEEARRIHNTTPTATAALGRTLTASSIMGVMMKGDKDKLTLRFKGNGPIRTILSVADSQGTVKGYIANPNVDLPLKANGKLDVGNAIGKDGQLTVIRDLGLKKPYVGQSSLVTGEIAEDLTNYFATSEQQPSVVALGVLIDRDISVKASGGYIIQVLPNISEEKLSRLEEIVKGVKPISTLIDNGLTPEDILEETLGEFEMEVKEKVDINLECDCSKEKIERALISLGEKELTDIINEDGKAEISCHFCNSKYNFNKEELEDLLNRAK